MISSDGDSAAATSGASGLRTWLADGNVVADAVSGTSCVFLAGLYRAEQVIADRLNSLRGGILPWPSVDPDRALPCPFLYRYRNLVERFATDGSGCGTGALLVLSKGREIDQLD